MGRLFVELEECLLLFEGDQNIDLTILQLANLEDEFNDIFDVDVNFWVGIYLQLLRMFFDMSDYKVKLSGVGRRLLLEI